MTNHFLKTLGLTFADTLDDFLHVWYMRRVHTRLTERQVYQEELALLRAAYEKGKADGARDQDKAVQDAYERGKQEAKPATLVPPYTWTTREVCPAGGTHNWESVSSDYWTTGNLKRCTKCGTYRTDYTGTWPTPRMTL